MGEVCRARDTRLDRTVASKILTASLSADASSRERFEREAKAISSLNHPNICVWHDVGRERPAEGDQLPVDVLVMEYLEGEPLAARLARPPAIKLDEVLAIAIPIAAALDRAHRQGIIQTGKRPFEGKSQASLIGAILDQQPPPVSASQLLSPPLLDEVVARGRAKDPDERWPTVGTFIRNMPRQVCGPPRPTSRSS